MRSICFYQSISLKLKSGPQCTVLSKSNSCRRWTRTTRCLSLIVLYTGGRASAMNWPSRRSTVASIVNFDQRVDDGRQFTNLSAHLCRTKLTTRCDDESAEARFSKSRVKVKVPEGSTVIFENTRISLLHSVG